MQILVPHSINPSERFALKVCLDKDIRIGRVSWVEKTPVLFSGGNHETVKRVLN